MPSSLAQQLIGSLAESQWASDERNTAREFHKVFFPQRKPTKLLRQNWAECWKRSLIINSAHQLLKLPIWNRCQWSPNRFKTNRWIAKCISANILLGEYLDSEKPGKVQPRSRESKATQSLAQENSESIYIGAPHITQHRFVKAEEQSPPSPPLLAFWFLRKPEYVVTVQQDYENLYRQF